MKKSICFLLFSILSTGLVSCSNEEVIVNPLPENTSQALSAKTDITTLIKEMVDKRFTFADKNKDKKLVFNEFKGLESEHEDVMKKMFNKVDTNKDSIVSYDEFSKSEITSIKSSLKQMFGLYDQNRNSLIDSDELETVVDIAYQEATDSGSKITAAQVKKDYLSYDKNGDGKLSFEEYQIPEMKYMLMAPVDPYNN